jgi:hypothetical protein
MEGLLESMAAEQARLANQLAEHAATDLANFEEVKKELHRIVGSRAVTARWSAAVATIITSLAAAAQAFWD